MSERACTEAQKLLRKIDLRGELSVMCGDCPYLGGGA